MPSKSRSSSTSSGYSHLLYLNNEERDLYLSSLTSLQSPTGRPESTSYFTMSSSRCSSLRSVGSSLPESTSTVPSSLASATISTSKYADDRYPLITALDPSSVVDIPAGVSKTHAAFWCARQMAAIHNTVIRALNSSYNHATSIESGTQRCRNFLKFNDILCTLMNHHHEVEDEFLFPTLEKLLGRPGAMEENTQGHESFMPAFHNFQQYISDPNTVDEFDGVKLRKLIESFAPELIQHLHDEIPTLLNLHVLDSKVLMKVWAQSSKLATRNDNLDISGPFILGCQDKSFLIDGETSGFPDMPWCIEVLIRKWHARKYAGVWEFCPSDMRGQRRLLKA